MSAALYLPTRPSMRLVALLSLIGLVVLASAPVPASAQQTFAHKPTELESERYVAALNKAGPVLNAVDRRKWLSIARQAMDAGEPRRAVNALGPVAAQIDRNPQLWIDLSRALLAITPTQNDEKFYLPRNATSAAYKAYQVAGGDTVSQAAALSVLATAFERRSYWRPAISALSASLELAEAADVRASYERLRAQHGFRVVDYSVESDSANPRLCIQFSENLRPKDIDYATFLSVDGRDPQAVRAETRQLCIEGFVHGRRYGVSVRKGLPSAIANESLAKTADLSIYVRDRSPFVQFTGRAYVLPSVGQQGIPVVTVNTEKVRMSLYRIGDRGLVRAVLDGDLARQFSGYDLGQLKQRLGQDVWTGEMSVMRRLNEEVTTAVPIGDVLPKLEPGVYGLIAEADGARVEEWQNRATQWFVVSDLGLTAFSAEDGLHGFVRSLATAEPLAATEVRLIAHNNEVLGTTVTDEFGHASFPAALGKGEGGMAPAILVAEAKSGDYGFLDLTSAAFDLTDRGVSGRPAPGPLDGFVFTERGVYRSGEVVHITALLRDAQARAVTQLPVTMIVTRPDGVEYRRAVLPDMAAGGRTTSMALTDGAMTGTWRLKIHADPKAAAIAETSFLVEDFVPERLDMTVAAGSAAFTAEDGGKISLAGRYLYGPPAADLAIEGDVIVRPRTGGMPGFEKFRFGIDDEQITATRAELADLPRTDAQGKADVAIALPPLPRTSRLLEARLLMRLREPGGRTIERDVTVPVQPGGPVIGIRPTFAGDSVDSNSRVEFDVVMLAADGTPVATEGLNWELLRVERQYQWYNRDGYWNYEAVSFSTRVADGKFEGNTTEPVRIGGEVEWGRYRLEVTSTDPSGPAASLTFYAGWGANQQDDAPEVLEVALDKEHYRAGETAKLAITSRDAGRALVAVLANERTDIREVAVPAGGATVDIAVSDDWAPGAYVTAFFYRPMDVSAKRMPGRAIGLKWLKLDANDRTIGVKLDLPAKVPSEGTLTVPVTLEGIVAGQSAHLVVAAVDVGILNLTGYETPAPENWYYAQRRLPGEVRDLYGKLIDGMRAERGSIRSGGDDEGEARSGKPPSQEPVALFSGLVQVSGDGSAQVEFDLPPFNGSLRVMAVAWSADRLGHGDGEVIVRDAIPMLVSAPRFLTLGDKAQLQVDLHNVEGPGGDYTLAIGSASGSEFPASIGEKVVSLAAGERRSETVEIKPEQPGLKQISLRLTGPGAIDITRDLTLQVNVPASDIRRRSVVSLEPGKTVTINKDLASDLIASETEIVVAVGTAAGLDVPGLLLSLDRYPYGCAEQTTSRALPLLYVNAVSARAGIAGDKEIDARIEKAIDRLIAMQNSSGGFGLWGPGSDDLWLSAYVTDFLTRAREQNRVVPKRAFDQALDRLQNAVGFASDFENGGEEIAYALYVLARNGRAPIGDLRYYADTRLGNFATPLAQAQLGAALAMYGDSVRAEKVFATAISAILNSSTENMSRRDYGTSTRDGAAALTLISEAKLDLPARPQLTRYVTSAGTARRTSSTQEQAWMLLAAKSLQEGSSEARLSVDGEVLSGDYNRVLKVQDLGDGDLVIRNDGERSIDAVITVRGASLTPDPADENGFSLTRRYFRLDGSEFDPSRDRSIRQNERLVVVLEAKATDGHGGRVLIVDRLPAGLEIENPRLVEAGSVQSLSWLQTPQTPEHAEYRDDRFAAAFNIFGTADKPVTVAYMVRAVNAGVFTQPPAMIEDMYRPERFARTAAGIVTVLGNDSQ